MDFAALAELCAPATNALILRSIASVESSLNPFAIGVVRGRLVRQPRNLEEAVATTKMLETQGFDYSAGLIQINRKNFGRYGLTHKTAFDICTNLRVGASIFEDCLKRAGGRKQPLGDALSCYYSGNFRTGYRHGYVDKVLSAGAGEVTEIEIRPNAPATRPAGQKRSDLSFEPEHLFVTKALPAVNHVAPHGENSAAPKGPDTALLF